MYYSPERMNVNGSQQAETHAFQADVARLLHLMVHSVYSDRDIFLRELISNASDACEKLRYESISRPELASDSTAFSIVLSSDATAQTLTVSDNGIGMGREELEQGLGTIASSGTRAFLDKLTAAGATEAVGAELIGQFGIGFYSAFMVADKVVVRTRRAGAGEAWEWTSNGQGQYTLAPVAPEAAPNHGTAVILHLNSQSTGYLEPATLERVVREHSAAIAIPIELIDSPAAEPRRISLGTALWAKPKSSIKAEEYTEFYRDLAHQFDEPAAIIHWHAEGRHDYTVLAFVPGSRPLDLFDPTRKARGKLYVRRVLVSNETDLLPGWLRFVRIVIDSSDLPLNVSREMIQNSPILATIRKAVASRIVQELTRLAESEPTTYAKVWENFGAVLKEGLYEEPERRDTLFKLVRFCSSTHAAADRTLDEYVKTLRPNQTAIYYLLGADASRLAASPHLEGYRARGIEVLLLPDPVDAFWVATAAGFDGKPFKSITQGAADIAAVPLAEPAKEPTDSGSSAAFATLLAFVKQTLSSEVADVRASDRLSESPACLIAAEAGPDRRLQHILAMNGQSLPVVKPVLELNPSHSIVNAIAKRFQGDADKALVEDAAWLLLEEARIMDGEQPTNAASFAARLRRVLDRALN
jgi:molecular chaperone HtpG